MRRGGRVEGERAREGVEKKQRDRETEMEEIAVISDPDQIIVVVTRASKRKDVVVERATGVDLMRK